MRKVSISELAALTGIDRRTVRRRLEKVDPEEGPRRALVFNSAEVLPILYGMAAKTQSDPDGLSLEEARRNESVAKTDKIQLEIESIRRERIPIEVLNTALDELFGGMKSTVKRSKLSAADKDEFFRSMREIPKNLKW